MRAQVCKHLSFVFFAYAILASQLQARPEATLPYPVELRYKIEFWKAVYTKYTTHQGVLHDAEDLSIIYDAIELPANGDTSSVDALRNRIREHIFNILRKRGENLTQDERKILAKFPEGASRSRLLQATENIRFQLGQADRFRQGLIRSGYYLKHIEKIIAEEGLPDFLKYLPHVESSFQENAISKFGAAGLWQLMPAAGREYLKMDYLIDERLDPWAATRAALRHLARDYKTLGSWPLALTAYNHGTFGVLRAMQTLGTNDIAEIAFRYQSPSFGFASRNFYAQFMAAREVGSNYKKYFGELPIPPALMFDTVTLDHPQYLSQFMKDFRFSTEDFRKLNPGLRPPVWENQRPLSKGTKLRVPFNSKKLPVLVAALDRGQLSARIAKHSNERIPELKAPKLLIAKEIPPLKEVRSKYAIQDLADGKGWVVTDMNETLTQIADWLKVNADDLRGWNGMDTEAQIRVGQKLLVKLTAATADEFQSVREDYHRQIREDFFSRYEVSKAIDYEVRRGENLWSLCYQRFELPPWLLQEYNVGANLTNLTPGMKLKIPVLREKEAGLAAASR